MTDLPERPRSVRVGRARVDCLSFDEAVARICDLAAADAWAQLVVTPNIQHVAVLERDAGLRDAYASAALSLPDGWPVARAAAWAGCPGQERVTGADLLPGVCAEAARRGLTVGILGGQPGAAPAAAERLVADHPGLRVAFVHEAPVGFDRDAATLAEVLGGIAAATPDILFVGLGFPRQEQFALRNQPRARVVVAVGAAVDFCAGARRRAPAVVQRLGLEWLFRIALEPQRLWRRYARAAPVFVRIVLRDRLRSGGGRGATRGGPG